MSRQLVLLTLATVLLTSCDGEPSEPSEAIDCSEDPPTLDVTVSTTANAVTFDWEPRCRVMLLGVEDGAGDRWWIGREDENLIEPPVRYGVTPDGVPGETALPLTPGETYEVILWIAVPDGAELAAVHEFTR